MSNNDFDFPYFSEIMDNEETKVYDEVCKLPTLKLFEEFDKTMENSENIKNRTRYDVIRGVIADRLGLFHRDVAGPAIAGEIAEANDKIEELDRKFKNHRHDTSKSYSGKSEW